MHAVLVMFHTAILELRDCVKTEGKLPAGVQGLKILHNLLDSDGQRSGGVFSNVRSALIKAARSYLAMSYAEG
jgi:hypothetical protein